MKLHLLITTAVLGILFNANAASPQEEARFLVDVKSAFEKKDTKAFLNLFCWDRPVDLELDVVVLRVLDKVLPAGLGWDDKNTVELVLVRVVEDGLATFGSSVK